MHCSRSYPLALMDPTALPSPESVLTMVAPCAAAGPQPRRPDRTAGAPHQLVLWCQDSAGRLAAVLAEPNHQCVGLGRVSQGPDHRG